MTAEELLNLLDIVRKSVGFTLRNPTGTFVIREYAGDPTQATVEASDGDWTCWRGDQIVFDNQLSVEISIKFPEPKVFGLSTITIPDGCQSILTVSGSSPIMDTAFEIVGFGGTGGGPKTIIVQPPGAND